MVLLSATLPASGSDEVGVIDVLVSLTTVVVDSTVDVEVVGSGSVVVVESGTVDDVVVDGAVEVVVSSGTLLVVVVGAVVEVTDGRQFSLQLYQLSESISRGP